MTAPRWSNSPTTNGKTAEPRGTDRVSGKLNLLKKTTFYDLRVSEFTSALSLARGETGTTFRRLRIEETEAMNYTNRLQHWNEQQPKHLSDIRRVGARTDWTRCRSSCYMVGVDGEPIW